MQFLILRTAQACTDSLIILWLNLLTLHNVAKNSGPSVFRIQGWRLPVFRFKIVKSTLRFYDHYFTAAFESRFKMIVHLLNSISLRTTHLNLILWVGSTAYINKKPWCKLHSLRLAPSIDLTSPLGLSRISKRAKIMKS